MRRRRTWCVGFATENPGLNYHEVCSDLGVSIDEFLAKPELVQLFHLQARGELNKRKHREGKRAESKLDGSGRQSQF